MKGETVTVTRLMMLAQRLSAAWWVMLNGFPSVVVRGKTTEVHGPVIVERLDNQVQKYFGDRYYLDDSEVVGTLIPYLQSRGYEI